MKLLFILQLLLHAITWSKIILSKPKMLSGVNPIFAGVEINTYTGRVIVKLKGPWKNWFGVGFGHNDMDDTYAIIVEGDDGNIQERILGHENPGTKLRPSENTYIINDETIFVDNKPVRYLEIEMDIDNGYFRFPTKSYACSRLDVIYGLGEEQQLKSKHFEKGVNFLELCNIYDQPSPPSVNDILNRIEFLDDGFHIEMYYDFEKHRNKAIYINNGNMPRSIVVETVNDTTISYVSTGYVGNINVIFALIDIDNDNSIDYDILLWQSSNDFVGGNGVNLAIDNTQNTNTLYVVDHIGIYKCMQHINQYVLDAVFSDSVSNLNDEPLLDSKKDCPLFLRLPYDGTWFHQQNYMKFNHKTGQLCFAMGSQCNICQHPRWESALHCLDDMDNPSFGNDTIMAVGVRNCVGFAFHPTDNKLWFTDNGRDLIGNNKPDGEINVLSFKGEHFGFPYCFTDGSACGDPHHRNGGCSGDYLLDPEFNANGQNSENINCESDTTLALQVTGPHSAPLGMIFYTGNMFPSKYKHAIFLAIHGSWNRDEPLGYTLDVAFLNDDIDIVIGYEQFAKGWLDGKSGKYYGRPVDIDMLPDGSILLTDDYRHVIYRIYYDNQIHSAQYDKYKKSESKSE